MLFDGGERGGYFGIKTSNFNDVITTLVSITEKIINEKGDYKKHDLTSLVLAKDSFTDIKNNNSQHFQDDLPLELIYTTLENDLPLSTMNN